DGIKAAPLRGLAEQECGSQRSLSTNDIAQSVGGGCSQSDGELVTIPHRSRADGAPPLLSRGSGAVNPCASPRKAVADPPGGAGMLSGSPRSPPAPPPRPPP